jgi:hypothetical protein
VQKLSYSEYSINPILQQDGILIRMENHGSTEDYDDKMKAPPGEAPQTSDLTEANIKQDDFAQEFPPDLPCVAMTSSPSGSPPFAASQSPSLASKVNENGGRSDVAYGTVSEMKMLEHAPPAELPYASLPSASTSTNDDIDIDLADGSVSATKKLEHAPPCATLPSPGLRILERPPVVTASSNHDVTPGAYPVPSSRNISTSRPFRSPFSSYDSTRQFTNEESKQEGNVSMAAESGFTAEAQRVPDGNEEETMMVVEAINVRTKWYQRRWIFLGSVVLACGLVVAVVVQYATLTSPTPAPTSLTPERIAIACNFLSIPNATTCRSSVTFDAYNDGVRTTGSTIPSEIGILTQLQRLSFSSNSLTSTIPSEIGLLSQLTYLSFWINSLTSTIPSEIGFLTQLSLLSFSYNSLTSTIPSEIGLLTQVQVLSFYNNVLKGTIPSSLCSLPSLSIGIDCGEITCDCCGC